MLYEQMGMFRLEERRLKGDCIEVQAGYMEDFFFSERFVKHWNGLPRGMVESPSLEVIKK